MGVSLSPNSPQSADTESRDSEHHQINFSVGAFDLERIQQAARQHGLRTATFARFAVMDYLNRMAATPEVEKE